MSSDAAPDSPPPQYRPKNRYFRTTINNYGVEEPNFKYLLQNHLKTEYQADDLISPRWLQSGQSNIRWFYSKDVEPPDGNSRKSPDISLRLKHLLIKKWMSTRKNHSVKMSFWTTQENMRHRLMNTWKYNQMVKIFQTTLVDALETQFVPIWTGL